MPIERDITATLRHRQEGDPKLFERAAADIKEMGRAADQAGDQSRQSAGSVDQLEDQVRQLEQALEKANKDLDHFKRTGEGIDQVRESFLNLRTAIATLAIGAVLDLLRRGLSETLEVSIRQEQALKALDAALESTGGQAGITKQELVGIAQGLQEVTNYGDEAIEEMEAILLTFTNLGREVLPEAIERVLDISTRMDGDLKSAALQVGKALNDPVANLGALSRAGIQFSDEQKNLIKTLVETGDLLGAQKIILAELETQFGGSARAARDTFGGALQSAQNLAGDLLEKIGEGGLSQALRNVAEDFTEAGSSGGKAFEEIGRVLGSLITLISILAKGAKAGMTAISGAVGIALGSIAHGVLELVDLLNEIPGLDKIIDDRELQHIRDVVQEFIKGVAEDTEGGLRGAQEALSKDLDRLIDLLRGAGEATAGGVKEVNRGLEGVDTAPLQRLQESVASFIEKVNKASAADLGGALGRALAGEGQKILGEFQRLGIEVPAELQKITGALQDGTATWRKAIHSIDLGEFRGADESTQRKVQEHFRNMVESIKKAGGAIGEDIQIIGNQLGVFVAQWDPVAAGVKKGSDALTDCAKKTGEAAASVKNAGDAAKESGDAIGDLGTRASEAAEGVRDVTAEVNAQVQELRKASLDEVTASYENFVQRFKEARDSLGQQELKDAFAPEAEAILAEYNRLGVEVPAAMQKLWDEVINKISEARKRISDINTQEFLLKPEHVQESIREVFRVAVSEIQTAGEELGPAVKEVGERIGVIVEDLEPMRTAAKESADAIGDFGEAASEAAKGPEVVTEKVEAMAEQMKAARESTAEAQEGIGKMASTAAEAGENIKKGAENAEKSAGAFQETAERVEEGTTALSDQAEAASEAGGKLDQTKEAAENLAIAEESAKTGMEALNDQLATIETRLAAVEERMRNLANAVKDAFTGVAELTQPLEDALERTAAKADKLSDSLNRVRTAGG